MKPHNKFTLRRLSVALIALGTIALTAVLTGDTSAGFTKKPFKPIAKFKAPSSKEFIIYEIKPLLLPDGTILLNGTNDTNFLHEAPPDQIFNPKTNEVFPSPFNVTGDYIGNYRFLETDWRCMKVHGEIRKKCLGRLGYIHDLKKKTTTLLTVEKNAKSVTTSLDYFHGPNGCVGGGTILLKNYHRLEFICKTDRTGSENTLVREFLPEKDEFIEYPLDYTRRGPYATYFELNNGQVLIFGGRKVFDEFPVPPDVELFEPKSRTIKTLFKTDSPLGSRLWELPNGKILLTGRGGFETLDLKTGARKLVERQNGGADSARLPNGDIIFAGPEKNVSVFDVRLLKLKKIGKLPEERYAAMLAIDIDDGRRIFLFGSNWCEGGCKFGKRYSNDDILEFLPDKK